MYNTISIQEFDQVWRKGNQILIDVRENTEWASGHIIGATHIPLQELPNRLNQLDKKLTYHVICYSGARSGAACQFLASQGYKVVNIMGGMSIWRGEVV
jgi:rhodanese-related sulfurtransferase